MEFKQVFMAEDGRIFESKADLIKSVGRPMVETAMKELGCDDELSAFLLDNEDEIKEIFEVGTIRRVTKSEYAKLDKAIVALKEIEGNKGIIFLQENASVIRDSFRWPTQRRLKPEEKLSIILANLNALTENGEVSNWIMENWENVEEAYKAGQVKRQISQKALDGLAAYRKKMAEEKEQSEMMA
jgi:hypothetical protein